MVLAGCIHLHSLHYGMVAFEVFFLHMGYFRLLSGLCLLASLQCCIYGELVCFCVILSVTYVLYRLCVRLDCLCGIRFVQRRCMG
jgi:hypothetical protein